MTDWIGRKISHYRVMTQLGQGGMGVVYLAEDLNLGRKVVLKLLRADLAADARVEERFLREARACASVNHPNITTIFEVNSHEGLRYICMEYVEGRTLRELLVERGTLTLEETLRVASGVADALAAAHALGIVHRDLKPENIMVTPAGQIKVLDFGLAAFTAARDSLDIHALETGGDRLTTLGVAIGTLHYMSPEQTRGRQVTPASDIFSLGSLLYETLGGIPPFRGDNPLAVMHAIIYDPPPPLAARRADVPAEFDQILKRCLRKEIDQRYADGAVLKGDLSRLLGRFAGQATNRESTAASPPVPGTASEGAPTAAGLEAVDDAPARHPDSELVGRGRELAALHSRLDRAVEGEGSLVLVAGEAGIGKTRLVAEIGRQGEMRGARYLVGRCLFREGGLPYHPFVEAAGKLIGQLGLDDAEAFEAYVRDRIPSLAGRLPILRSFLHLGGHDSTVISDKDHLLDAISALFLAFARERPMVLHVDDLHWADEATLDLLLYLARNCRNSQGLIIGTYRPEEVAEAAGAHPLGRVLDRMSATDLYLQIDLARLGPEETAAVIASALQGARLPPDLVSRLHRETAGNPFYVLETLRLLVEDGTLTREGETWRLAGSADRVHIPGRVHDVVMRRLGRLSPPDREVLEIAAAEGMVFHSGTIGTCLERSRIKVLGTLQRAEKEHRLIHAEKDRYTFDHPLIREILYESIIPELRREYHSLIGRYLSGNRKGRPGEEAAIAYQLLEAGEEEAALPFLLDAGDRARRLYANAEALSLLDRAETILTSLEGEPATAERAAQTIRLHKERGRLHQRLGDHDRAMSDYLAMRRTAVAAGLVDREAHSLCLTSDLYYAMGDYDQAFDSAGEARNLAQRAGDKRSLSNALRAMGAIHFYRAEYDAALLAHNRSIELQKEIDDLSGYAENLNKVGNIHLQRGDRGKAEAVYSAALALARQSGNHLAAAESLNNLGVMHYYGGEADSALKHFEECLSLKREIGDKRSLARSLSNLALVFEMRGDLQAAHATHEESLAFIRNINDQGSILTGLNNLANVLEKMGRYGEALAACEECLEICETVGDRWVMPYTLNSLGRPRLWLGEAREAAELFERALEMTRRQGQRGEECLSLQNLGAAHAALDSPEKALALLDEALALARELGARERESEILYLRGTLHAARGEAEDLAACTKSLVDLAGRLRLAEVDIRRLHLEGLAALAEGPAGRERAARLLGEAGETAERVGLIESAWRIRADRVRALGEGPEAEAELLAVATAIEKVASGAGSPERTAAYRAEPLQRALLEAAALRRPRHDDSGRKLTDR